MKVVYIPIILPINIRTFWAMGFGTLGLFLLGFALLRGDWLNVAYTNPIVTRTDGDVLSVTMHQSLQVVTTTSCYYDTTYPKEPMCSMVQVEYVECESSEKSLWCEGKNYFVSSLAIFIIAMIGASITTVIGFYRELWYGPLELVMGALSGCAIVLYRLGANKVTSVGPAYIVQYIAKAESGSVNVSVGASFMWAAIGVSFIILGSLISSSLLVYRVESSNVTAQNPPRVQVVNMQVAAGGNIASMAPRPGFVALSRNEFQLNTADDDDDDLDLIQAHPAPAPAARPPPLTDN
eukprot:GILI01019257.1.p1 GENE.GILI01019257.1~~GILI01019257.1.p1  ORF type:complete len:293 (+),score=38.07 GILI01019257.1:64-942(+)